MARGGINKAVVQKARQALLAKGLNPTIDRVRSQMGNTGSNTTISRYLRELEASEPKNESSRQRLGSQLTTMVEGLLSQLVEEGEVSAAQARMEFEVQRIAFESALVDLQTQLSSCSKQLETQQEVLEARTSDLHAAQSAIQGGLTRNAELSQHCSDLEVLTAEKGKQIQSLEDKHTHARGALEHYRESVKEQREQDQRRHESQLNEMQTELRKLRETLSVKQDESTCLNRDNERLLGESRQQAKTLHSLNDQVNILAARVQTLTLAEARAQAMAEHHQAQASKLHDENKSLDISAAQASIREADLRKQLAEVQAQLVGALEQLEHPNEPANAQTASEDPATAKSRRSHVGRKGRKP